MSQNGNPYDVLIDEDVRRRQSQLVGSLSSAVESNPDQVSAQRRVATYLGFPLAAVEAMPKELNLQAAVKQVTEATAKAPALQNKYLDPEFAKLAHDDAGKLSEIEQAVRKYGELKAWTGPKPTVGSVLGGLADSLPQGFRAAREGMRQQMGDLFDALGILPRTEQEKAEQLRRTAQASGASAFTTPDFESSTAAGVYGGLASTLRQAPGIALSVLTRSSAPVLASIGVQTQAEAYGKYRTRGATPGEAALGGALEGGVEVATELLPMSFLVNKLGKTGMTEFFTGLLAREIPGEQLATILQDAVDTAIANPDKTWADYLNERPEAAYQTLVATVTQSAVMGGVSAAARRALRDTNQINDAETDAQQLAGLFTAAGQSKLRERDPASFADLVQGVADQTDGAPKSVFIDAEVLAEALQNPQAAEVFNQMPQEVLDQLPEALATGGTVELPIGELIARATGTPLEQALLPNLRAAPDALSQAEAQEAAGQAETYLQQQAERVIAEATDADAMRASAEVVKANVLDQLNATKRFRPDVNEAYATLARAFYTTMAGRTGVTPEEMFARYPLRIVSEQADGGVLDKALGQMPAPPDALKGADGKPLRLYHGTSADIQKFRPSKMGELGPGVYFTTSVNEAGGYTGTHRGAANIVPVYLTIKNPLRIGSTDELWARYPDLKNDDELPARLQADGYDGIVFPRPVEKWEDGKGVVPTGEMQEHVVVFDPKQIVSSISGETLGQGDQAPRATFSPSRMEIALLKDADLSSFLHEMGHFFLEVQADLASQPGAPQQIVDDFNTVLKWFGIKGDEKAGGADSGVPLNQMPPPAGFQTAVVGADGQPLRMYHGTKEAIEGAFRPERGMIGTGVYFTANPDEATEYATNATWNIQPNVVPAYIEIRNPFYVNTKWDKVPKDAAAQGYDGVILRKADGAVEWAIPFTAEQIVSSISGEVLAQNGPTPDAPAPTVKRTPAETWAAMTLDQKRPYHERWAESFEQYLFEGKAPSVEMRGVFQRFREFMISAYKSLKNFLRMRQQTVGGQAGVFEQAPKGKALLEWYGEESNLRNPDGTPMVLYHGTTKQGARGIKQAGQMRRSSYGAMGSAIYLGDSAEASSGYDQGAMLKVYARGKYLTNMQWTEYVNQHGWKGAEQAARADGWAGVYDTKFESAVAVWDPANIKAVEAKRFAEGGSMYEQPAYHGTPYRGIEKFDTDFIGTGEGAQAYGYGLYFAGRKEVADYYRRKLAGEGSRVFTKDGKTIESAVDLAEAYFQPGRIVRGYSGADKVLEFRREGFNWSVKVVGVKANGEPMTSERPRWHSTQPDAPTLKAVLEEDGWKASQAGQLYEVDIPEDSEMLLWDKPLSEQPEKVQNFMREVAARAGDPANLQRYFNPKNPNGGPTGQDFYEAVSQSLGSDKAASDALAAIGIKGIKYLDGTSRAAGDGSYNYVVFSGDDVAIRDTFYQSATRDQTETPEFKAWFGDSKVVDAEGKPLVVYHGTATTMVGDSFNPDMARSEGGAFYFSHAPLFKNKANNANEYAKGRAGDSPQVMPVFLHMKNPLVIGFTEPMPTGDAEITSWLGRMNAFNRTLDRDKEKFYKRAIREAQQGGHDGVIIRNVEDVPNDLGRRFTDEADVYIAFRPEQIKSAIGNRGTFDPADPSILSQGRTPGNPLGLSDEVRGVFDRLIATDEQIAEAQSLANFEAVFKSAKEAGMTPEEWAAYQEQNAAATTDATEDLQKKSLADMKWAAAARGKALRKAQAEVKEKRDAMRAEVKAEVEALPIEQARAYIKALRVSTPEQRDALKDWGDRREAALERAREEVKAALLASPEAAELKGIKKGQFLAKNKKLLDNQAEAKVIAWEQENPRPTPVLPEPQMETIAEQFGFTSGDELRRALVEQPPAAQFIDALTEQRLLETYGELVTADGMARAANEAVHNEARRRFVATELAAMQRAMSATAPTGKTDRKGRPLGVNVIVQAAKSFARTVVDRRKILDLKPAQHAAAATRAAARAAKLQAEGKTADAIGAKRDQLLSEYTARYTTDAAAEVERGLAYLRKFDKASVREKLPADYVDQIDQMLERFELKTSTTARELDRRANLAAWVAQQQEMGLDPVVPEDLLANTRLTSYKQMTVEEFRGLVDGVKNVEHLARLKSKLLAAKDKREFDAIAEEITASIIEHGGKPREVQLEPDGKIKKFFKGAWADHRKLNSLIRQMDGGKDNGPFYRALVRSMNDAGARENTMLEQATEALAKIYAPIEKLPGGFTGAKLFIPEINNSLSRAGRLSIALNWGNPQNRQRVMDGDGWTEAQVNAILRTLTPVELKFVNDVWAHLDSYWPEIKAKQERVSGVVEDKVEAVPFEIRIADATGNPQGAVVQMRGGYYPIKYDTERSIKAEKQEALETARQIMQGAVARPTTRRGHTKARVDEVKGRPVLKDLRAITQHVNQVVHDLAWHEWFIDANRLLNDKRIASAIRQYHGNDTARVLKEAADAIAVGDTVHQGQIDRLLLKMRSNVTRSIMGASLTTALLQPFGLTQSMARIGVVPVLKGAARWAGDAARMESTVGWINEKSEFMRLRSKTFNRELREISERVQGKSKFLQVYDASLFMLMQKLQMVADVPTWVGAYEKALAGGVDESTAVALADEAVLGSQGGGTTKDLSAVQRNMPFLTQFYSYFNTTLNLVVEQTATTNFKNPKAVAGWMADMALLAVIPAILPALLTHLLKGGGEDDEPEDWAKKMLEWQAGYMFGMFVGLRELPTLWSPFDYAGPPAAKVLTDAKKVVQQANQGEVDDPAVLATISLLGTVFGIPTVQIIRSYKGWQAWSDGDAPPSSILFGPPPRG